MEVLNPLLSRQIHPQSRRPPIQVEQALQARGRRFDPDAPSPIHAEAAAVAARFRWSCQAFVRIELSGSLRTAFLSGASGDIGVGLVECFLDSVGNVPERRSYRRPTASRSRPQRN
jgi:hypothetical protein